MNLKMENEEQLVSSQTSINHKPSTINQLSRSDFELMAPVGSWESLVAAHQGGADAIYFGIENLNMRSKSSVNFSIDDLHTIAQWCAERGIKTYLTMPISPPSSPATWQRYSTPAVSGWRCTSPLR